MLNLSAFSTKTPAEASGLNLDAFQKKTPNKLQAPAAVKDTPIDFNKLTIERPEEPQFHDFPIQPLPTPKINIAETPTNQAVDLTKMAMEPAKPQPFEDPRFAMSQTTDATSDEDPSKVLIPAGQAIARQYAATGARIASTFHTAENDVVDPRVYLGTNPAMQKMSAALFGTLKPFNATSEDVDFLQTFGVDPGVAKSASGGNLTLLLSALDLTGLGEGGSGLRGAVAALKDAKTVEEAFRVAREIGIAEDIAHQYAPLFAAAETNKDVKAALEAAVRLHNETKLSTVTRTASGVTESIENGNRVVKDAAGEVVKVTSTKAPPKDAEEAATRYYDEVIARKKPGEAIVIGADDMKYHFGNDFAKDRHAVYSKAANDVLMRAAAENPSRNVVFMAGGPGSGKSEVIASVLQPKMRGIIYDSNLSNLEGALRQIDQLEKMGKKVEVYGILRDPESAYHFAQERAKAGKHTVTDENFATNHAIVPENLMALIQKGKDVKIVDVRGITTREGLKGIPVIKDPFARIKASKLTKEQIQAIIARYDRSVGKFRPRTGAKSEALHGPGGSRRDNGRTHHDRGRGPEVLPFEGFHDITTKILDDLKGKTTVSKKYILEATNRADLKQAEKDIVRALLKDEPDTVNVKEFADKVKAELLDIYHTESNFYENVALPPELRGPVANYTEHIYRSPIKTSAGEVHYHNTGIDDYFAHARVEDLPGAGATESFPYANKAIAKYEGGAPGDTRRVLEIQSDLFQKGRLEGEEFGMNIDSTHADEEMAIDAFVEFASKEKGISTDEARKLYEDGEIDWDPSTPLGLKFEKQSTAARNAELSRLRPYTSTWHERIIREEVRHAAKDGKTRLQFPTGETAMKIEGLGGRADRWSIDDAAGYSVPAKPELLEIGKVVEDPNADPWVITAVLGDGKFKAVPKSYYDRYESNVRNNPGQDDSLSESLHNRAETFDISGKVDTNNPIYKFYEKEVGRYLKNKYGATLVTDAQGVKWWEVKVKPGMERAPVEAFGAAGGFQDDDGKKTYDPVMGALGFFGLSMARKSKLASLIRAETRLSGVKDLLKTEFRDMSESARGAFAEALMGLTDERKISDMLDSMQRVNEEANMINPRVLKSEEEAIAAEKADIEEEKAMMEFHKEALQDMPGRQLARYADDATGNLPDMTGKDTRRSLTGSGRVVQNKEFGKRGDQIAAEMGMDVSQANEEFDRFKEAKEEFKAKRGTIRDRQAAVKARVENFRDRKAVFEQVVHFVNKEGTARREKVQAVQDFFVLDDADMKQLTENTRDVRLMSDGEFDDFMKQIEGKATEMHFRQQALMDLHSTIFEKELEKTDNLRKAMKMPQVQNMSLSQIKRFNEALQPYQRGDEFLGPRQLETVKHTDLSGIKTRREALERLQGQVNKERASRGEKPVTVEELNNIKVHELDRYRYDTALARQNPVYDLFVQEKNKAFLEAEMHVLDAREKVNELFDKARASRSRGFLDRLIPSDTLIFKWLEASDADKLSLAKDMTKEELEATSYIRASYAEMRDYLVKQQALKRFRTDYITHIRRGFLEAWKEEGTYVAGDISGTKPGPIKRAGKGLLAAMKEVFQKYQQDEAYFNILDQRTDQILPLEKFFQYSMRRTGELVPSKNVAKAYTQYLTTFEKKRALDAIVPKLDIYVHSLTPKRMTTRGLEFDRSLKNFFKEWMNSKKGRATDRALVKPGGQLDWALRSGVALTRLLDLGLSVPVGIASNLGAQAAVWRGMRDSEYLLGHTRMFTKQGRKILHKYRVFTGEPVRTKVWSAEGTLGESAMAGVFGLFSFADRKARQVYLLGKMTPEEFKAAEIPLEKLARMQTQLGRHLPMPGAESIIGKTAIGKVGTQYKSWAVPILSSTMDDVVKAYKAVRTGDKEFLKSAEFAELLRTTVLSATVGLSAYGILTDKTPMKDRSFMDKIAYKAAQDALSLIGALDPSFWTGTPRLLSFLFGLGKALRQIVTIEENKSGELTGPKTLQSTVMPAVVRQLIPGKDQGGIRTTQVKIPKVKIPSVKIPGVKI